MEIQSHVRYEATLDKDFARWATSIPGGEKIRQCTQCGVCSGACPLSVYMDYTPRKIVVMTREGFKDDVLSSHTIWLCASCYACTVECPIGINLAEFMYALKARAIKEKRYPKKFPTPIYAQEFMEMVAGRGRGTESLLAIKSEFRRRSPIRLLKRAPLGFRLMRKGRMKIGLGPECVKDRKEIAKMLDALGEVTHERKGVRLLSWMRRKKHSKAL